jgi:catechol 2,3-dioxygenase-like lactoylglutathione lyase family enzyme
MGNGRVLGIGGIFFKSNDAVPLRNWYRDKLGIDNGQHGAMFHWRATEAPNAEHLTIWSIFPGDSKYYDAPFMINYIVEDLDALLERLKAKGVSIDPKREDTDYGRFAWIYDADGNKVELWEPPPASLESSNGKKDSASG